MRACVQCVRAPCVRACSACSASVQCVSVFARAHVHVRAIRAVRAGAERSCVRACNACVRGRMRGRSA